MKPFTSKIAPPPPNRKFLAVHTTSDRTEKTSDVLIVLPPPPPQSKHLPMASSMVCVLLQVEYNEKTFQITVDVSDYSPEDISVKVVDDKITLIAKQQETADEHGFSSRQMARRFLIPEVEVCFIMYHASSMLHHNI